VLVSRADSLDSKAFSALQHQLSPVLRPGTPVLPMERGVVDPALILGLNRDGNGQPHAHDDHSHDSHSHEAHSHAHDTHDHVHVAMESLAFQIPGSFSREKLESTLAQLIAAGGLIRVKGRLLLEGKARPLQIQAVGPRLECWFEGDQAPGAAATPGLELVILGFGLNAPHLQTALESALLVPVP